MKKYRSILIPFICALLTLVIFKTVLLMGYVPSGAKSQDPQ